MKIHLHLLLTVYLILSFNNLNAQISNTIYKKGTFFMYWGWNHANYTKSDIHFSGTNYDFTLSDVVAKDRQTKFDPNIYFSPAHLTIPQYNFRLGYFIKDNYQLSFGADHMKYVMQNWQTVKINGHINNSGTSFDGTYNNENIILADSFLLFEHTDGLNYENFELRRFDVIYQNKIITLSFNEGLGFGVLMPRTNTTLMKNARYDEFHLAGYGMGIVGAINLTLFKHFFIQSEWKGGFINMPDIRTTMHPEDRAKQHFFFSQYNIVFGFNFKIPCKQKTTRIDTHVSKEQLGKITSPFDRL